MNLLMSTWPAVIAVLLFMIFLVLTWQDRVSSYWDQQSVRAGITPLRRILMVLIIICLLLQAWMYRCQLDILC